MQQCLKEQQESKSVENIHSNCFVTHNDANNCLELGCVTDGNKNSYFAANNDVQLITKSLLPLTFDEYVQQTGFQVVNNKKETEAVAMCDIVDCITQPHIISLLTEMMSNNVLT